MPESLPIALALVVCAVAAWDTAKHYMQLAHGRLMAADKQQAFERELTAQSTRIAKVADNVAHDRSQHDMLTTRVEELAANVGTLGLHTKTGADRMLTELEANAAWRTKAESTLASLAADIDKRDAAITNVAE